jgi:hypothetical protein
VVGAAGGAPPGGPRAAPPAHFDTISLDARVACVGCTAPLPSGRIAHGCQFGWPCTNRKKAMREPSRDPKGLVLTARPEVIVRTSLPSERATRICQIPSGAAGLGGTLRLPGEHAAVAVWSSSLPPVLASYGGRAAAGGTEPAGGVRATQTARRAAGHPGCAGGLRAAMTRRPPTAATATRPATTPDASRGQ